MWVQISGLPVMLCVSLTKLLDHSGPLIPCLFKKKKILASPGRFKDEFMKTIVSTLVFLPALHWATLVGSSQVGLPKNSIPSLASDLV